MVGIALAADVQQRQTIAMEGADGRTREGAFALERNQYDEQRLTVARKHVELSPEDLARHERERVHLAAVLRTFTPRDPDSLRLQQEVGVVGRGDDDSHAGCGWRRAQTGVRHGIDCCAHAVVLRSSGEDCGGHARRGSIAGGVRDTLK